MSPRSLRLLSGAALIAGALFAAPANASGVRACGGDETGVIVSDGNGDLVTLCVRTQDTLDIVHEYQVWVGEMSRWPRSCKVHPGDPTAAECDTLPPPPGS